MQRCSPCPSQPIWIPSRIWPQRQVIEPCISIESDVELCTHFGQPRHPAPPRSWTLGHRHLPTLCLLDALAGKGFVGEACVIEHDLETPRLVFDNCSVTAASLPLRHSCSWASFRWRDKPQKQSTAFHAYLSRHSKLSLHEAIARSPTLKNSLWCRRL